MTGRPARVSRSSFDGTIDQLSPVPVVLVLACRNGAAEQALPFVSKGDRDVAEFVSVDTLALALRHVRHRLAMTVFCSGSAGRLAPSLQSTARLPGFVTFGADAMSARHGTLL